MSAGEAQQIVLDYYSGEAAGKHPKIALGGLKIVSFKTARKALLDQGKLERTPDGRYRPAGFQKKQEMLKVSPAVQTGASNEPEPPAAA